MKGQGGWGGGVGLVGVRVRGEAAYWASVSCWFEVEVGVGDALGRGG